MKPSVPPSRANSERHYPDLKQIEQWTRETAWENEGGRALKDEQRSAAAMSFANVANDNGAESP